MIPLVIDLALTAAAKEDRERFSLTWLRQQGENVLRLLSRMFDWMLSLYAVRIQARKAKKQIGPRLNRAIKCALENGVVHEVASLPILPLTRTIQEQLGYFCLQRGTRNNDISVYMSARGHHECVMMSPEVQYSHTTSLCYRYTHRTTAITILAQPLVTPETHNDVCSPSS